MKSVLESINDILSEWDPFDVGADIATDEYRGYIPVIAKNRNNKENLIVSLEDILINKLEVGYDKNNSEHINNLTEIVEKIMQLNGNEK